MDLLAKLDAEIRSCTTNFLGQKGLSVKECCVESLADIVLCMSNSLDHGV